MTSKYRFLSEETINDLATRGVLIYFPNMNNKKEVVFLVFNYQSTIEKCYIDLYIRTKYKFHYQNGRWLSIASKSRVDATKYFLKLLNEGK